MSIWTIVLLMLGWALIFFISALWETRNIKDAFDMWLDTMREWKAAAIAGVVFLGIIAFICWMIDKS